MSLLYKVCDLTRSLFVIGHQKGTCDQNMFTIVGSIENLSLIRYENGKVVNDHY